ncbi:MAG: DUF305 domain-containing protein [Micrococcaceae bacterium]
MKPNTKKLLITATLVPTLSLTLAACNSTSQSTSHDGHASATSADAVHNSEDTAFAQMMIIHHRQALDMSDILLSKQPEDPQIVAIVEKIQSEQQPEIDQMKKLLKEWKEPENPEQDVKDMEGMISEVEIDNMKTADTATGEKLYLVNMINHHQGAVQMAQQEVAKGQNPEAKALAQQIIDAQTKEIAELKNLQK